MATGGANLSFSPPFAETRARKTTKNYTDAFTAVAAAIGRLGEKTLISAFLCGITTPDRQIRVQLGSD